MQKSLAGPCLSLTANSSPLRSQQTRDFRGGAADCGGAKSSLFPKSEVIPPYNTATSNHKTATHILAIMHRPQAAGHALVSNPQQRLASR